MNSQYTSFNKKARFNSLIESVQFCDLCPRLNDRKRVLSWANGNINSKVLFIAEAPGRLGADRTGIPLFGDKSGDNFEVLLGNIGWKREQIFITNAVLCNPRNEGGKNGTPCDDELKNCSAYLEMVLSLVQPEVIATLGVKALDAINILSPFKIELRDNVAKPKKWRDSWIFPLYHPGPRAIVHRSIAQQRSDFMRLAKFVHPEKGLLKGKTVLTTKSFFNEGKTPFYNAIRTIIEMLGKISYFRLTKLLYLVDFHSLKELGRSITNEIYLRQTEGPWPPKLKDAIKTMLGYEIRQFSLRQRLIIEPGPSPRFDVSLDKDSLEVISKVVSKYGRAKDAQVKSIVYNTSPMRYILRQENKGRDMRKIPVIYEGRVASEIDNKTNS